VTQSPDPGSLDIRIRALRHGEHAADVRRVRCLDMWRRDCARRHGGDRPIPAMGRMGQFPDRSMGGLCTVVPRFFVECRGSSGARRRGARRCRPRGLCRLSGGASVASLERRRHCGRPNEKPRPVDTRPLRPGIARRQPERVRHTGEDHSARRGSRAIDEEARIGPQTGRRGAREGALKYWAAGASGTPLQNSPALS
jgi:hypothetical protein